MQRSGAVGFGLEQGAQIEFQSDREQQQDNSDVRYLLQSREGGEAEDVQEESGREESDQRRDAQLMGDESQRQRGGDRDDDVCHAVLLDRPRPRRL